MFYTTIENQLRTDGSYGLLYDHFTEESQLTSDGRILRQEIFDRREPEPDPVQTPETEE